MDWLDTLDFPARTHTAMLTGRDVVTGEQLACPVVWADRHYDTCPGCGQPVSRVVGKCPVMLDTGAGQGGRITEWSQQHGCGAWLPVDWAEIRGSGPLGDVTGGDFIAAARRLATRLAETIAGERERIRRRLSKGLQDALDRIAGALEDDETAGDRAEEIRTGSEVDPGIYQEYDGEWMAWDYDPDGTGDTITVRESDLAEQAPRD